MHTNQYNERHIYWFVVWAITSELRINVYVCGDYDKQCGNMLSLTTTLSCFVIVVTVMIDNNNFAKNRVKYILKEVKKLKKYTSLAKFEKSR